jgi:LPS sulfotransferase NodH
MKFVVLCHPRCGSTLLMEALGAYPNIRQGSEILNPILDGEADYVTWRRHVMAELYGTPDTYLTQWGYLDDARFDLSRLVDRFYRDFDGAKIMFDHAPRGSKVWSYLQAMPDLRVIVLERNPIAAAISFQVAMTTNVWHIEMQAQNPEVPPLRLETTHFETFYNHFCAPRDEIVRGFRNSQVLHLTYSNLINSWETTLTQVQEHLELPPIALPKLFRQRRDGAVTRPIENWDELEFLYTAHPVLGRHIAALRGADILHE